MHLQLSKQFLKAFAVNTISFSYNFTLTFQLKMQTEKKQIINQPIILCGKGSGLFLQIAFKMLRVVFLLQRGKGHCVRKEKKKKV